MTYEVEATTQHAITDDEYIQSVPLDASSQEKCAIVVDSCADISSTMADELGISVIPLQIIYSDRTYRDGIEISTERILSHLNDEIPSTSTPLYGDIEAVFDTLAAQGVTHVMVLSLSSVLSGTYDLINRVAQMRTDMHVVCIDTKTVGVGIAMCAVQCARALQRGVGFERVCQAARELCAHTHAYFCVEQLDYLFKGGRLNPASYAVGRMLDMRPVLTCNAQGEFEAKCKTRGRKASLKKTLSYASEDARDYDSVMLAVVHADAHDEACALKHAFLETYSETSEVFFSTITSVLAVHTGPGLVGIVVQEKLVL